MIPLIDKRATGTQLRRLMDTRGITVKDVQQYLELGSVQSIYHWLNAVSYTHLDVYKRQVELRMKNIVREGMFMPAYFGETANACALDRCIEPVSYTHLYRFAAECHGYGRYRNPGTALFYRTGRW